MRISDWSSDVCSSDLARAQHDLRRRTGPVPSRLPGELKEAGPVTATDSRIAVIGAGIVGVACARALQRDGREDRKSVVSGKSVSVRVDLGGRLIITKKKTKQTRSARQPETNIT